MDDDFIFRIGAKGEVRALLKKEGLSGTQIRRALAQGRLKKGGRPLKKGEVLGPGDQVQLIFEEEDLPVAVDPFDQKIIYEDQDLLVLNKAAGLASMPCAMYPRGTLAGQVAGYFKERGLKRKVRLVGRLDKETTGLVAVAKNPYIHNLLDRSHTRKKTYLALVQGALDRDYDLDLPIGPGEDSLVRRVVPGGQEAITHIRPLLVGEAFSLVKIYLETGRTHQIRAHLTHLGHPLLGDDLYGGSKEKISRVALHVASLSLYQPRLGRDLSFFAPLPQDMDGLVGVLKKETK
ncbi:MAG: RluA family pseudouridine synthase [Tissierellia bacterium]|nr:RluA family pseudouridine synthase [Tissierellia bacterium]